MEFKLSNQAFWKLFSGAVATFLVASSTMPASTGVSFAWAVSTGTSGHVLVGTQQQQQLLAGTQQQQQQEQEQQQQLLIDMMQQQWRSSLPEEATFLPGTLPLDTNGDKVHAHGGCVVHHEGDFFWFGESEKMFTDGDWLSEGVALYSSPDLVTWRPHGLVLAGTEIQVPGREPPFRIERPKVVFNRATQLWVMYIHLDLPNFWMSSVGVATSTHIQGPYTFQHALKPDGLDSYDMTLFQDDDGTAYLVRSVQNQYVGISALTEDYLNTSGIISTAAEGEAQAVFKYQGQYFMLASHLTGWSPNPLILYRAELPPTAQIVNSPRLQGASWRQLESPTSGPSAATTYNSQPAFVLPVTLSNHQVLHIYLGDRWNYDGPGSVGNASYVWLPLLPQAPPGPQGDTFRLPYLSSWSPRDFMETLIM